MLDRQRVSRKADPAVAEAHRTAKLTRENERLRRQLTQARKFSQPIVTALEPLAEFFLAEQYHQDYARAHPDQPYIQAAAIPKACKVREKFPQLLRRDA